MDWPILKKDPSPGDVLWHSNDLIVLVLRRRLTLDSSLVDVLWLYANDSTWKHGEVTTHNGELQTWRDWQTP